MAEAFATALDQTPDEEREAGLLRAIDRIERSGALFSRDALSAILAIFGSVGLFPKIAARLYQNAVAILIDGGDATRRRVTPRLAEFLLAPDRKDRRRGELAASFVESLGSAKADDTTTPGLVRAIQLSTSELNPENLLKAKENLAGLSDDLLTPFFEPVDVDFVEGPVIQAYVARLAQVDLTAADLAHDQRAADRLFEFAAAGGAPDKSEAAIATRLSEQLATIPGDISADATTGTCQAR